MDASIHVDVCNKLRSLTFIVYLPASLFTLFRLVDLAIITNWTSPFPIVGVSGEPFHFCCISNRNSCSKQCILITPRSVASDLGCQGPTVGTLGINGIRFAHSLLVCCIIVIIILFFGFGPFYWFEQSSQSFSGYIRTYTCQCKDTWKYINV